MRYYLNERSSNNYLTENLSKDILKIRGVADVNEYCNPKGKYEESYKKLINIKKAVKCLLEHIEKNSKIFFGIDPDVDGFTSAAILINYLKRNFENIDIVYKLHTGKQHGLSKDMFPIDEDIDLIIMTDSSSNDYKQHKELKDKGVDIIVLDHHEAEKISEDAIVVNNQLCDYQNKHLSGVGVVYKFLQAIDEELWRNDADDYLDLVALGLIGDNMDVKSLETKYYINRGLNNIKNRQFKALISKQEYSIKGKVNMRNIAFYISPLINAMIRVGKQEEKELLFKGFIEEYDEFDYKPRGSEKIVKEDIYTRAARLCSNTKSRQDKLRDQGLKDIINIVEKRDKLNDKVLVINSSGLIQSELIGVVAIKVADKYNRPCLLLRGIGNGLFGGSGRNTDINDIKDLKLFLKESGMFDLAEGHPQAFGVRIKQDNIKNFIEYSNKKLENVEFDGSNYCVDYIVPFEELTDDFISQSDLLSDFWGKGVDELQVAITNLDINTSEIQINGKNKNTIKFVVDGIEFIKFQASGDKLIELAEGEDKNISLEIVGKPATNEWNKKKTLQIKIEDYNIL